MVVKLCDNAGRSQESDLARFSVVVINRVLGAGISARCWKYQRRRWQLPLKKPHCHLRDDILLHLVAEVKLNCKPITQGSVMSFIFWIHLMDSITVTRYLLFVVCQIAIS